VNGWVRNLSDSRVEAVFEGEKDDVKKLIKCVSKGPKFANVSDLKLEYPEYKGEYKDFQIIY
jgi:acylphosphatase